MLLNYNVTGNRRKALVKAVSEILGENAVYNGTPSFSFTVGGCTIDRNGTLSCSAEISREKIDALVIRLKERGYTAETVDETPDYHDLRLTEREELGLGRERRDLPGEDGMLASDVPDCEEHPDIDQHHSGQYANPDAPMTEGMLRQLENYELSESSDANDALVIEMPLTGFTPEKLDNLTRLVNSKATLIKKALGTDNLPIAMTGETLRFPWFSLRGNPDEAHAYTLFVAALCDKAKRLTRVTAIERPIPNEKFTMRLFLVHLGFIGAKYKTARRILLSKLTGNTAFKYGHRPIPAARNMTAAPINETEDTEDEK